MKDESTNCFGCKTKMPRTSVENNSNAFAVDYTHKYICPSCGLAMDIRLHKRKENATKINFTS